MSGELSRPAAHGLLQLTVVLWGGTAILGRLIGIPALPLVWYRLALVVLVMLAVVPARGLSLRVAPRTFARYAGPGALIGLHWLCFYGAIKAAGVATGVLTLSTIAFFTALFDPLLGQRRRVAPYELVIGALVVGGVALLLQLEVHVDARGLGLGLLSAVFSAAFGVQNGVLARQERPERLLLFEMIAALATVSLAFVVAPDAFVAPWRLAHDDLGYLVMLAVGCTVVPQLWVLRVLRVLSPFTVAVAVNLEPVYSLVMLVALFPGEESVGPRFLGGAGVLVALVIANAWLKRARTE